MFVIRSVWSSTENFGTIGNGIFCWNEEENATVAQEKLQQWTDKGFIKNTPMVFDALDASYSWSGYILNSFSFLTAGALGWDGFFGQGTTTPNSVIVYKIARVAYIVTNFGLNEGITERWQQPYIRWPRLLIDVFLDCFEWCIINKPSEEEGREGHKLDHALYKLKLIMFATYFLSTMIVFGAKSLEKNDDGSRETGYKKRDFLLGAVLPLGAIISFVWTGIFEKWIVSDVTSSQWPETKTDEVDGFLPITTSNGAQSFRNTGATDFSVRLFPNTSKALKTNPDDKKYYVEDESADTAWARRAQEDERLRKENSINSALITARVYNDKDRPPEAKPYEFVYISPDKAEQGLRRIYVEFPKGNKLLLDDSKLVFEMGKTKLTINNDGDVVLNSNAKLTFDTKGDTTVKVNGNLELNATGDVKVEGANVSIKGKADTTLEGGASTTVKAASVKIAGKTDFSAA